MIPESYIWLLLNDSPVEAFAALSQLRMTFRNASTSFSESEDIKNRVRSEFVLMYCALSNNWRHEESWCELFNIDVDANTESINIGRVHQWYSCSCGTRLFKLFRGGSLQYRLIVSMCMEICHGCLMFVGLVLVLIGWVYVEERIISLDPMTVTIICTSLLCIYLTLVNTWIDAKGSISVDPNRSWHGWVNSVVCGRKGVISSLLIQAGVTALLCVIVIAGAVASREATKISGFVFLFIATIFISVSVCLAVVVDVVSVEMSPYRVRSRGVGLIRFIRMIITASSVFVPIYSVATAQLRVDVLK